MNPTTEQQAIYDWFQTPSPTERSLVVQAYAGTGKTTTIIEGVNRAPEARIMVCAFNKDIRDELHRRITNTRAHAKTLHGIGFGFLVRHWRDVKVSFGPERADSLAMDACGAGCPEPVRKLVAILGTKCREMAPLATTMDEVWPILERFELEPDEQHAMDGFDAAYVVAKALATLEIATRIPADQSIDGADMIFLPLRLRLLRPSYNLVVVDEAQDMTSAQLEIARRILFPMGRIVLVGDSHQAIYGFRGADSHSLPRLQKELRARVLKLTLTFRCAKRIVEEAHAFVPDFRAAETNPEGQVGSLVYKELLATVREGDFVLSRMNAPLVSTALHLIRNGKRARIAGRDIGAGLVALVKKLAKGPASRSIPLLCQAITRWEEKQVDRYLRADKPGQVEIVRDKAAMLLEFATGANSVTELTTRIQSLFADDHRGDLGYVRCSSVHRAKGLEAPQAFLLGWTFRKHEQEELNICYVAVTRAKTHLWYVAKPSVSDL